VTIDMHMSKARRALTSARLLHRDGDTDGACNRAYYAMFDAATAALLAVCPGIGSERIRTHNGLISAFGEHLVKTGRLHAALGRALNQVERVRLLADYTGEEVDAAKAAWTIEQADGFIAAVAALIEPAVPPDARGD
jgi:uncharacterized protein (UPF0332 family)